MTSTMYGSTLSSGYSPNNNNITDINRTINIDTIITTDDEEQSIIYQSPFKRFLERKFALTKRKSTLWNEFRAGTSTFVTMAYIILVNSRLLGFPHSGIPRNDVMIGTIVSSSIATFLCGYFGNLPFALAPGLGLSAYMSMEQANPSGETTWQVALASCAVAGFIQIALAVLGFSSALMKGTPRSVQSGTVIGMGLLLSFVAVQELGLIEAAPPEAGLIQLSDNVYELPALISFIGLIIISVMSSRKIVGSILLTVLLLTFTSIWVLDTTPPQAIIDLPHVESAFLAWDFTGLSIRKHGPVIVAFVLVGVFDVAGVLIGLAHAANLTTTTSSSSNGNGNDDDDAPPPGSEWAFAAAGVGTVIGAAFGSTPVIVHLESAAGVSEGGKTGLTAIVVSLWFALSLFIGPLVEVVPAIATAPVLFYVGMLMMSQAHDVRWHDPIEGMPAFVALTLIPFTFSVPNGVAFGAGVAGCVKFLNEIIRFTIPGKFLGGNNNNNYGNKNKNNGGGGGVIDGL
jgi:AGZA family xanthine/uracil permease-like MFS transporter